MVYVDIEDINGDIVRAAYRPEKIDAEPGEMIYDKARDEVLSIKKSADDMSDGNTYVMHAIIRLRQMLEKSPIKMSGYAAWY